MRIGPVRLSSELICAPGWASSIKTAQIWAPILSGRQPPVSLCRVMRQCAWAEILPPIWAFFVPREQFPVCSLNGGDNKQHVGLQTRLRFPVGRLPGTIFPGISSEAELKIFSLFGGSGYPLLVNLTETFCKQLH